MGGGKGIIGGVSSALFGDNGAEASQNAAIAQQIQAGRNYNEIKGRIDTAQSGLNDMFGQARQAYGSATVAGLNNADKAIGLQEKNLSRQEQLVSQIDPTIIEASQQALRLLKGEQSSALDPLKNQRDTQRQKLVNSLREQLGPGAETSTAGIQALTRFDSETSNIMNGAQQSALSNLGGVAGQFNATRPDMFRDIMGLSQLGQNRFNIGTGQANFLQGLGNQQANFGLQAASQLNAAANPMTQSAGAGYVKDAVAGQAASSFGSSLIGGLAGGVGGALGKSLFS